MRALGTVAEKLSFDPTTIRRADWDSLRSVGLDDEGCLEFAHIVGIFNHLTRLADGFGIKVDPQTMAAASGGPPLRRTSSAE
jgi:uncharacterized protein YciW